MESINNIQKANNQRLVHISKAVNGGEEDFFHPIEDDIAKSIQAQQLEKTELLDVVTKGGKDFPVGTIRKRGQQNWIKTADPNKPWKYHSKVGSEKAKEVEAQMESATPQQPVTDRMDTSSLASRLFTLVNRVSAAKTFGEQMNLIVAAGITDPEKVVQMTKADLSNVLRYMEIKEITPKKQNFDLAQELASLESVAAVNNLLPKVPVKERWESYRLFLDMVANGINKSAIAYGTGGIGKTYNAKKIWAKNNLVEYTGEEALGSPAYDYVKITGKSTPTAMYKALYEHNGKLIMFDDCDSVLRDETSINIFKGALDSTGDGTISYGSGKPIKDSNGNPIPQRFSFNGRVAFISNLTPEEMPQPLRSRALTIDLTMTADETVEMMRDIVQVMPFQNNLGEDIFVSPEDRTAAIEFIAKYKDRMDIGDLNARTLGQIALIKKQLSSVSSSLNWETAALATIT